MIFAVLEDWYHHIVLTHSCKLLSFFYIYLDNDALLLIDIVCGWVCGLQVVVWSDVMGADNPGVTAVCRCWPVWDGDLLTTWLPYEPAGTLPQSAVSTLCSSSICSNISATSVSYIVVETGLWIKTCTSSKIQFSANTGRIFEDELQQGKSGNAIKTDFGNMQHWPMAWGWQTEAYTYWRKRDHCGWNGRLAKPQKPETNISFSVPDTQRKGSNKV